MSSKRSDDSLVGIDTSAEKEEILRLPVGGLIEGNWIPIATDSEKTSVLYSDNSSDATLARVNELMPTRKIVLHPASRKEVQEKILQTYPDDIADIMANKFSRDYPQYSAKMGFSKWQRLAGAAVALAVACLLVEAPGVLQISLETLLILGSSVLVVVSLTSVKAGKKNASNFHASDPEPLPPERPPLPFYTVLVPVYDEAPVMRELISSLGHLQYPRELLEIIFLIEKYDTSTKDAALEAGMLPHMRIVDIPIGCPRTKPRSCNLGLLLAKGDLITIYDAEDRPEPDQLMKAAAAFAADRKGTLACVQARLYFYNSRQNILTGQFDLEYSLRYGMTLPGLARLNLPIPLGGTSNHFNTSILRELGGWDAWNVTEDADLGMRCRAMGYQVDVIDSITWEEATSSLTAWTRQRTRWLKGFMMTVLVHTRNPLRTWRAFGASGAVTLLGILAASPMMSLALPIVIALTLAQAAGLGWASLGTAPTALATAILLAITAVNMIMALISVKRRKVKFSYIALILLPLYWMLSCVSAWRALIQLIRSPFVWEKTSHGHTAGGSR